MNTFDQAINQHFSRSVTSTAFLDRIGSWAYGRNIAPDRTLPLVSICRDELTSSLFEEIQLRWGVAFTLAGLGGVPALGTTGWNAAFSHIPDDSGRGAVLVFGFPHIGIEQDGSVGVTIREGQSRPTSTCGALASIFRASQSGTLPASIDIEDYEASKLALRLVDPVDPPKTLVDLTVNALEALEVDVWKAIDQHRLWADVDVAVFCGVQIHGHGNTTWIWPRDAWYAEPDGTRVRIDLTS